MLYPLTPDSAISPEAIDAGIASLRSGRYTMGDQVAAFEQEFATWVGATHAVMVNSGSSANLLAVEAMLRPSNACPRWQAGDEVLVPALAWSTTVFPLAQLGLVPVFVDVDPNTLALDMPHAMTMMSNTTRGAMLIHVLGRAVQPPAVNASLGFHVMEDCCESFGAHLHGRHAGTFGTVGTFSHFFSHQLPTIEGGMCVTADAAIADDLRSMRAHGWSRHRHDSPGQEKAFHFVTTGYNVRPLEVQAAIGRVQLRHADANLRQRDDCARHLIEVVHRVPWLEVIGADALAPAGVARRDRRHSWMNVPIVLRADAPIMRDAVTQRLNAAGVETRPILAGNLLDHPVMRGLKYRADSQYPVADRIKRDGFMIGCHGDGLHYAFEAFKTLRQAA